MTDETANNNLIETAEGDPPDAMGTTPADEEYLGPDAAETGEHDLRALAAGASAERREFTNAELHFVRRDAEVVVPLDRAETIIGRDPRCDIVLEGDDVSRRHACVRRLPSGYFELADLGSANGTVVQGGRVEAMQVLDGDRFTVGSIKITVHIVATEP